MNKQSASMAGMPVNTSTRSGLSDIAVACRPDETAHQLLKVLETDYGSLIARLTSSLHSSDAATDALHDAYLKLGRKPALDEVRHPLSYLYRMAINLAKNHRRREARFTAIEASVLECIPDDAPDPELAIGAQHEMALALSALSELPVRCREIFLACWRDDKTQAQIAQDFRLHRRTVQKELTRAERHLRTVLGREKQHK